MNAKCASSSNNFLCLKASTSSTKGKTVSIDDSLKAVWAWNPKIIKAIEENEAKKDNTDPKIIEAIEEKDTTNQEASKNEENVRSKRSPIMMWVDMSHDQQNESYPPAAYPMSHNIRLNKKGRFYRLTKRSRLPETEAWRSFLLH